MPRFTLRDVFLATTLIALGIVQFLIARALLRNKDDSSITMLLVFLAPVTIGAGIGAVFQRPRLGTYLGALMGFFSMLALVAVG